MAIALVGTIQQVQAVNTDTTPSLDSTGANLLIAVVHDYEPATQGTISDSKGNTWVPLTAYTRPASAMRVRIYYATNSPTVGSGHTATLTATGNYYTLTFMAFSGAHATAPFDTENGAGPSGTTFQAGSITPAVNGSLLLGAIVWGSANTPSIDSGFSTPVFIDYDGGTAERGGAVSYLVQTTAAGINPTWTLANGADVAVTIAAFAPGAGGGGDVTPAPSAGALNLAGTTGRLGFTINLPDEA
jgi:hypothetical protein